jgi:hypothetical protein
LAGIGLAATAATVVTGGGSITLKGAATVLRVARRADALSPGMRHALAVAARSPNRRVLLAGIAASVHRIGRATSAAEVLPILRLADNPEDLKALARLSEAAGSDTRRTLEALGKARSLRLLSRISDLALAAMGLAALVIGQVAALAGALLKLAFRAAIRP